MGRKWKALLKGLVPPLVLALVKKAAQPRQQQPTWAGIYPALGDVPVVDGTYDDARRVGEMSAHAGILLAQIQEGKKPVLWHEMMATVAAVVAAERGGVRVLDFGGGMGTGFMHLISTLPETARIEYDVIEMEQMCAAGRALFVNEKRLRFHTTQLHDGERPDIVYVNSVLQYIEDYAAKLRELAALQAPWVLLVRTAAGDFPTFATRQLNLPGQVLPYWFFNRDEIVATLRDAGYALAMERLSDRSYDMSNFPETHRQERMRHLLFARTKGQAE
ncbi:methyltransferase, TIGR04325 family [Prosthecobacter sp.]|uniref:methyltransferase, TIGR04325 family n=1 Tax=Prosthecobacter sp. TaxID=1965333 RepID=UPI003783C38A